MRDRQRRTAVDDGDDRGSLDGRRDDARQLDGDCGRLEILAGAEQLLGLEVDEIGACDGADGGVHVALRVSSAPTSAVARRAADVGDSPLDLAAR